MFEFSPKFSDLKCLNTLQPGSFIYSEDTRSIFSGFRSVWIKCKSCISARYDEAKVNKLNKEEWNVKTFFHPWTEERAMKMVLEFFMKNKINENQRNDEEVK